MDAGRERKGKQSDQPGDCCSRYGVICCWDKNLHSSWKMSVEGKKHLYAYTYKYPKLNIF